jgi:hypothetical protein
MRRAADVSLACFLSLAAVSVEEKANGDIMGKVRRVRSRGQM